MDKQFTWLTVYNSLYGGSRNLNLKTQKQTCFLERKQAAFKESTLELSRLIKKMEYPVWYICDRLTPQNVSGSCQVKGLGLG